MRTAILVNCQGMPERGMKTRVTQFNRRAARTVRQLVSADPELVVCSGGKTGVADTTHSEAYFLAAEVRRVVPDVRVITEDRSLSTLENLLNTVQQLRSYDRVIIVCEATRAGRTEILARRIIGRRLQRVVRVTMPPTRQSVTTIREKELHALRFDRWALMSSARLRKHHWTYVERNRYRRQYGLGRQHEGYAAWLAAMRKTDMPFAK